RLLGDPPGRLLHLARGPPARLRGGHDQARQPDRVLVRLLGPPAVGGGADPAASPWWPGGAPPRSPSGWPRWSAPSATPATRWCGPVTRCTATPSSGRRATSPAPSTASLPERPA